MLASVQELLLAAQAKQKPKLGSMLAQLINAGSTGYSQGVDIANTRSETDLRRAEIAKRLVETQQMQDEIDAQNELRRQFAEKLGLQSEKTLRDKQAGVAPQTPPPTPAGKFTEKWQQDAKGNVSRSLEQVTPPPEPAAQPKPPTGFRYTQTGDLEPIPGGPADIAAQTTKAKADLALAGQTEKAQTVLTTIDEAIPLVNGWSTGAGSLLKNVPLTDANKLVHKIDTITSNLGIDQLAEMKAQSKTGASGFGALNEKELNLLLTAVTNLGTAQDKDTILNNLNKIKTHYSNWLELQKGNNPYKTTPPPAGTPPPPNATGAGTPSPSLVPTLRWNAATKKLEKI